jgi:hypothetical protein
MQELIAYISPLWFDERTHRFDRIGDARNIQLSSVTLDDIRVQVPDRSPSDLTLDYLLAPYPQRATKLTCELPTSEDIGFLAMRRFLNHFFNLMILASDFPLPDVFAMVEKPRTSEATYTGRFQCKVVPFIVDAAVLELIPVLDNQLSQFPQEGVRRVELALNQLQKSVRDEFGRASFFDSHIETAIGIESIFNDGDAEVTYTLSMRSAAFNGTSPEERLEIFHFLRGCYSLRSQLVHGNYASKKVFDQCFKKYVALTCQDTSNQAAFKERFRNLLRETIRRLLLLQLVPAGSTFDEYVVGLKTSIEIKDAT